MTERKLTGRTVFIITASAFAVIIGVNLVLAVQAVRTFPGLEVRNSYVASQSFDAERTAQEALGWTVAAETDGRSLVLSVRDSAGAPVRLGSLDAVVGRATHEREDRVPDFVFDGSDYRAEVDLGPGNWNLRLSATAEDGTAYRKRIPLYLK